MLTKKQIEELELLETLRKQIELLDSHKVVGLINDKQYNESLMAIVKQLEVIEEEHGITYEPIKAFDLLFKDGIENFNKMIDNPIFEKRRKK